MQHGFGDATPPTVFESRTLEMQLLLQYLMQQGFGDATPPAVFDEQDFGDATPPTVFDAAGLWRCNSSYSI